MPHFKLAGANTAARLKHHFAPFPDQEPVRSTASRGTPFSRHSWAKSQLEPPQHLETLSRNQQQLDALTRQFWH
jgi:hypothetical protein